MTEEMESARQRRAAAADRYRPPQVELLLVAEAPPPSLERYFYFEDVKEHDSLFRYVVKGLFEEPPSRSNKGDWLEKLKNRRVFLMDLVEDPMAGQPLKDHVEGLIERARKLSPKRIVLIKAAVFDAAFVPLRRAGLPVVNVRIPFPGSGQQMKFEAQFKVALSAPL